MICESCGKQTTRLRYIHIDGKLVGGCNACADKVNPSRYPTDKRLHEGPGYSFTASPAHIRDIKHRKVAGDGRSVERSYK